MSDTIIINYPTDEGLTINIDDNDDVIVNIIDDPDIIVNLCDDLGTTANNYDYLDNKPSINNVELVGNKTLDDLGIEPAKGADNNFVTDAEKAELHSHSNKSVLDSIIQSSIDAWNIAYNWVSSNGAAVLSHIADSSIHVTSTLLSTINNKLDKVEGKGLSTNDFTNEQKELLSQQSGVNTGDQDLSGLEPKRGADDFYLNNAEKTQGGLATGNTTLDTVKKVADRCQNALIGSDIVNDSGESLTKVLSQKYVTSQIKDYTYIEKTGTIQAGYYCRYSDGAILAGDYKILTINVSAGDILHITGSTRSSQTALVVKFDAGNNYIGYMYQGTGVSSSDTYSLVDYVVESGVSKIVITSEQTEAKITTPSSMIANGYTPKFYSKTESDLRYEAKNNASKYGVRFDITGKLSQGERLFSAVGLSASIGIGGVSGYSDFNTIYPWSEMKRCNIKSNANGAYITTFEGESGFSLTGNNGDVFVRIPKFYYDRYISENYEYITISDRGTNVHPAFIENGKELEAVYVSAFEGGIYNGNYSSVANVIPKTNIIASELLALAKARGSKYTLYDNRIVDMLFALISVEFANRNTNRVFGYGIADYIQPATYDSYLLARNVSASANTIRINNGGNYYKGCFAIGNNITICDTQQTNILTQAKVVGIETTSDNIYIDITFNGSPIAITTNTFIGNSAQDTNWCETINSNPLTYHTGRSNKTVYGSVKDTFNPMRYRWIENIVGNIWHYLPDVTFNNLQMYICDNIADYEMHKYTGAYKPIGDLYIQQSSNGNKLDVTGNFWVGNVNFDVNKKALLFGKTINTQLLSTEGYGAYYYLNNGTNIIANGGGFDHLYRCNLLTKRVWIDVNTKWFLYGGRLIFKDI